jgi:subtilisin-like proprotein convertase family protein
MILWDTNEASDSFVSYGETSPPGTTTPTAPALVTAHSVKLQGLRECSLHYFSVGSADPAQNLAVNNNNGNYYQFETGLNVSPEYNTADPPVAIPAASPTPVFLTINVPDNKTVLDVDVRVNLTHTYDGDIIVSLRHPDGTTVTLSNRRGGGGDNFTGTRFDDEATTPIASGAPPFTGSFIPDGPLAVLDGKSSQGVWQLEVLDNVSGDSGNLTGFDLILTYPTQSCGPDCDQETVARLSDTCVSGGAGTGDGRWDDGEEAVLNVTLKNTGQVDLTGVTATLTPITPGVTLLDATASYPGILREATATAQAPYFTARVDPGTACGSAVEFQVTIQSDQGTFVDTFQAGTVGEAFPGGIATAMLETFAGGIPGTWTVVDGGTGGGVASTWTTGNPGNRAASAPITTPFAIVDSDWAGSGAIMDESLITPPINLTLASQVFLDFDQYFRYSALGAGEIGDVDVRSSLTGGAWVNVLRNQGASSPNPDHQSLEISDQAAGAPDVQIRFRYVTTTAFEWYWQVDNVQVTYPAPASCTITSCALLAPPGEVQQLLFGDPVSASWTPVSGATGYNLYRGADFELPKLVTNEGDSCLRVSTAATSATGLLDVPGTGGFDWWLVRASNAFGEGPAGAGSAGQRLHEPTGICP